MAKNAQTLFNKIEQLEKPVIAVINGACLGGGMELAMSCHIRLAADGASMWQPELNLGFIPGFGGTQRLPRLTNTAKALELILTSDFIKGRY
jgi:enoyl-CoA hydratase